MLGRPVDDTQLATQEVAVLSWIDGRPVGILTLGDLAIEDDSKSALADLSAAERRDDGRIEEAARLAVRRVVRAQLGKKPLTDVHIVHI